MTGISAKKVMELRKKTGVSMMVCKSALLEANGDEKKAIEILRKKGISKADSKSTRETREGAVAVSGKTALMLLCETDFVARNEEFLSFLQKLTELASQNPMEAEKNFENMRPELIAKLGENLKIGGIYSVSAGEKFGKYIHSNKKIAVVVGITGGNDEIAKDVAMHIAASNPKNISPDDVPLEVITKEKEFWKNELKDSGKPREVLEKIFIGKEKKFREENALLTQKFLKNSDISVGKFLDNNSAKINDFIRIEI